MSSALQQILERNDNLSRLPIVGRDRHSVHFRSGTGSRIAVITSHPMHYWDGNKWAEIDLAPTRIGDTFSIAGLPIRVSVDGTWSYDGRPESVRSHGIGVYNPATGAYRRVIKFGNMTVDAANGRLIQDGNGWQHIIRMHENGVKEEFVLTKKPNINYADGEYVVFETAVSGFTSYPNENILEFADFRLGDTVILAGENPIPVDGMGITRIANIKGQHYRLQGFRAELIDRIPAYPLIIDPSTEVTASTPTPYMDSAWTATWAAARSTSLAYGNTTICAVGRVDKGSAPNYSAYRSAVVFDTSGIDDGATITDVKMRLTLSVKTGSDENKYIVEYDWSEWEGSLTNATYRETAWDGILSQAGTEAFLWGSSSRATNTPTESTDSLSNDYVNKTGKTYYGLIGEGDKDNVAPSVYYRHWFCSASHSTATYRPILVVEYSTGTSGSLSVNLAAALLSASGTVLVTGTLSKTLAAIALSAAGKTLATGTLSATLANASLTATGTVSVSGSLTRTLDAATLSATGTAQAQGQLSQTLADATVTAAGTVSVAGQLSQTLEAAEVTATGTAAIAGTLSQTLADATATGTGTVQAEGTLTQTLADCTLAAIGTVSSAGATGTLTQTLEDATITATGTAAVTGSATVTLADCGVVSTGTVSVSGALGQTLEDASLSAAGEVDVTGSLTQTLADATLSASGVVGAARIGTLNVTLADASLTAAGYQFWLGSVTVSDVLRDQVGLAIALVDDSSLGDQITDGVGLGHALIDDVTITEVEV